MDDCLKSVATEAEAVQLVEDITALCNKGGFELTKWISNSRTVIASIPDEQRAKEIQTLDLDKDHLSTERALGLEWCVNSDQFQFNITIKLKPHTRRGILSVSSSIFDPFGFLAPFILSAKQILQELCKKGYGWDEPLPHAVTQQWTEWINGLEKIKCFSVTCCIKPKYFGITVKAQLHHFADASESGYGSVSYLRLTNEKDMVRVAFMIGKSRVLPLKQMTVPRLELAAAVLVVKIDKLLRKELHLSLEPSMFWTDSQSVLKYIGNAHTSFKTYVANRVSLIRENTNRSQWRYVSTKCNPADEASRGMNAEKFLECSRWIHGPEFLWYTEESSPKQESVNSYLLSKDDPEVKREIVTYVTVLKETETPTSHLISYFSNWMRLLKAVAWNLRLRNILSLMVKKRKEPASNIDSPHVHHQLKLFKTQRLTVEELAHAEKAVILYTQRTSFPAEMTTLETKSSSVQKKSSLYRLDPILNDGILRVGGRLHKLAMPEETKHQVILPKDAHISTLLLRHAHEQSGHSGRNYILSHLLKKYWIIKGNSAARKIISKCVICRRVKGRTVEQKMADLPLERILPDLPPFTNVGLDYFGPIEVKRGRGYVKRYGVIFTCMSSRAVHLQVANSLETDS